MFDSILDKLERFWIDIKIKAIEKWGKETSGVCVDENYSTATKYSGGMSLVLTIKFTDETGEERQHPMYYPEHCHHNCKFTRDAVGTRFKIKYLPRMTKKIKKLYDYKFPYVNCIRLMQEDEIA